MVGHVPAYLSDRLGFFAACANGAAAVRCRLGTEAYLLNDPEDVRHVLAGNHGKYAKARRLAGHRAEWLSGHGLLTSTGADHLRIGARGFAPRTAALDMGYDVNPVYDACQRAGSSRSFPCERPSP